MSRSAFGKPRLLPALVLALSLSASVTVAAPRPAAAKPTHSKAAPTVSVDTSTLTATQSQAIAPFVAKVPSLITDSYPKIVDILGAKSAPVPAKVTVLFKDMDGVAATGGTVINVSEGYVEKHPEDTGMIVHELTHIVQGYPKYDPVWLVEGIADYVRFFYFEPVSNRPHPDPAKASYHDSYRTTAAFLDWTSRTYDKDLVKKLDAALKAGTYTEDVFQKATGKSLEQLNTEWLASLPARKS